MTPAEMLQLARWNTPTIYNGWEQITACDAAHEGFNREPLIDFAPWMGPLVGRAVTVVIEPGNPAHRDAAPDAWHAYREYVASVPGPKVVVVQDLDKPALLGAFWGEVNSTTHRALGCVGSLCDGAVRDLDEVAGVGFKILGRGTCVGHAHSYPVRWGGEVEVFGCPVAPGRLIHGDRHGFLVIPPEDEDELLAAAQVMDRLECETVIPAAQAAASLDPAAAIAHLDAAGAAFRAAVDAHFGARRRARSDR